MNKLSCIKSVPLTDLEVVAVCYVYESGYPGEPKIVEVEVLNKELFELSEWPEFRGRCDCCGSTRLQYNCQVVHKPTGLGYHIGRTCASKIESLAGQGGNIENWCVALAERVKARKRVASWILSHSEHAFIVSWAESATAHPIAKDIAGKLARYGDISSGQIALLYKLKLQVEKAAETAALEPKPTVPAPEGRVEVTGEILCVKSQEVYYGAATLKMLVRLTDFNKVWVTLPLACEGGKGDVITFKATFERSEKDEHFAFGKRPTFKKTPAVEAA